MNNRTVYSKQNLREVWEAIEESVGSNEASLMRSALLRFTLPGLGGLKASGDRLKNKEVIKGLNHLSTIVVEEKTPEILCAAQAKTFEMLRTPKERQRQPRYYLNQFIKLGIQEGFFLNPSEKTKNSNYEFYSKEKKNTKYIKTTNRIRNLKFTLSLNPEDYELTPDNLSPEEISRELSRIKSSLEEFESHCLNIERNRPSTIENRVRFILLILGWMYEKKKIPLTQLSLNSLIPFINLTPQLSDFSNEENPLMKQMVTKALAVESLKQEANKLVSLVTDFFAWLRNPPSLSTKRFYLEHLITLAKYIYRDQTDKTMARDFSDVPIVTRLRVFHCELKNQKNNNASKKIDKYLPWGEILQVFEKLRFEADLTTIQAGRNYRKARRTSAIAKNIQDCVLLGMFVLVPPPRQRVVRELEFGRTLKYGFFKNGNFTPAEELLNPDEAKYYIDLQPEDYKTGNIYGRWTAPFPNVRFHDGKCFYDYLNLWLFQGYQDEDGNWHGMRSILAKEDTKTVFVAELTGEPYPESRMSRKIKNFFVRWTKVPLSPHDLRHIYRTHIEDPKTGATEEEKESAAFWMRHSAQMAKKVYSHLDCEQKLHLGTLLCSRINQQFLGGL